MVRITDVARHAGVSPSTVSYALSGKRPISAETRRRVEESVRALGYRPHGRGSRVLALAAPLRKGIDVPSLTRLTESVVTAARRHDHDVLLLTQEEGPRRVAETGLADGLIVTDVQLHDPRLPLLRRLDRPSVLIGLPADPDGLTCVDLDFRAAAEACVDHLARLGHRVVALVGPPPEVYVRGTASAQRVIQGFTTAADRHRLTSTIHPCEASPTAAHALTEQLLREQPALTGVVVHNDAALTPLLDAFEQQGLRVPDTLSLTAICPDDLAESIRIPVTSAALPTAEMGARAVHLLLRELSGERAPGSTLLAARVTERGSTGRRRAGV
ncbi:LacI family DNA-binding transcriptional regulator [Streptomyces lanatus]|uniref:LacI family DNA-binding transcriptional regulator n=1 Tax=Streptomyces lanatus TaxID=66900 RepID=A0ABV1Y1G4_9ACTN|nr:LacI family DNA-binding transcriptional regulator [Streptomyces lanatus]GHH24680.1 LacI family transcriptional regulator [Streptomyces lanatus]